MIFLVCWNFSDSKLLQAITVISMFYFLKSVHGQVGKCWLSDIFKPEFIESTAALRKNYYF